MCTCTHVQGINEVADHFGSWKKGPESEKQFEPMVDRQSIIKEYSHFKYFMFSLNNTAFPSRVRLTPHFRDADPREFPVISRETREMLCAFVPHKSVLKGANEANSRRGSYPIPSSGPFQIGE